MVAESSESQAKAKAKAKATTTTTQRELPDGFVCPITCLVMRDPVMLTGDGHTYERHAIECWLNSKGKKVSPLTGAALGDNCLLVPNHAVRKAIAELKVDVPTQSEIESLCGGGDRDKDEDKDGLRSTTGEGEEGGKDPYFVPFSKQRTYFEDKMFVFASLRRNLYSLESTVCVWKAGQLCLPSRVTTSVVDTSWQSTLKAQVTCMKALDMNKVVVSGSRDKLLRVWDTEPTSSSSSSSSSSSRDGVRHLRQVYSLPGHTDWVNCVDVSKDEEVVVSGSRDNTLKVWNTMKWQCNHTMRTGDIINCVAFDKVKNDFFVSGGNDWKLVSNSDSWFKCSVCVCLFRIRMSCAWGRKDTKQTNIHIVRQFSLYIIFLSFSSPVDVGLRNASAFPGVDGSHVRDQVLCCRSRESGLDCLLGR